MILDRKMEELFPYITKEEFLPLLRFRNNCIDVMDCLVIEMVRNNVIDEEKVVTGGRIYISDAYKEVRYQAYADDFIAGYEKLHRWIKKNIPKQTYLNGEKELKGYISNGMIKYSREGYRFF